MESKSGGGESITGHSASLNAASEPTSGTIDGDMEDPEAAEYRRFMETIFLDNLSESDEDEEDDEAYGAGNGEDDEDSEDEEDESSDDNEYEDEVKYKRVK